jgi:hypothetical protein
MANTKITSRVIADNSVGIDALNVTDGTNGQYLQTDGAGTLSFSTVSGYTDSDVETYLDGGTSTPILASFTVGSSYPLTSYDDASQNLGITLDTPFNSINNGGYNTSLFAPLANLTDGYSNAAFGLSVLTALTSGSNNTFFGNFSAQNIATASNNTGIGTYTLVANTADSNTAVGYYALYANTASGNTAVGAYCMDANTTGNESAAFGYGALGAQTTGGANVAVGYLSGQATTIATNNTYVGRSAGATYTTGTRSVAIGSFAAGGTGDKTGDSNTSIGYIAGAKLTSGRDNVCIGDTAGNDYTTQVENVAIGNLAAENATGSYATYVGHRAGRNATGDEHIVIGSYAFDIGAGSGYANTVIGQGSARYLSSGFRNSTYGSSSGQAMTTGAANVCVGYGAGSLITTSSSNTVVGGSAQISSATSQGNEVVLGAGLTGIGYHQGILGGVNGVYNQPNSTTFATTSDERIKKNIEDYTLGLDTINNIRVRTFEYRELDEIPNGTDGNILSPNELPKGQKVGVIAQEIINVLPSCVTEHENSRLSVTNDNVLWTLVKAVQELSAEVEELKLRLGD